MAVIRSGATTFLCGDAPPVSPSPPPPHAGIASPCRATGGGHRVAQAAEPTDTERHDRAAGRASPVAPALQAGPQVGRVEVEELADGDEAERRSIVIGCKPFGNVPEETPIPTAPATLVNLPATHRVLQHGPQQAVLGRERSIAADQGGVLNRKQEFVLDRRIEPRSRVHARVEKQERCPRPSPPSRRASVGGADRASQSSRMCRSAGTLATPRSVGGEGGWTRIGRGSI
jgi:hypothetical protein